MKSSPFPHYQPSIGEKCGVFGIYGKGLEAARMTYFGLYSLQHRGQESSGIVSSDGKQMYMHRKMGLVAQVYREEDITSLKGHIAIGHNRYTTSKSSTDTHIQPVVGDDTIVALAHNGNLPSTRKLEDFFAQKKINVSHCNDSELMAEAIRYYMHQGLSLVDSIREAYPLFTGAFSLVVMTNTELAAVRDSCGIRPLSIGTLGGGYVFASETCAIDTVGGTFLREVGPGEMVVVNKAGLKSYQLAPGTQKLDIFEFIYFARPDSVMLGQSVDKVRQNLGVRLAREHKVEADIVIAVPDSATPAAIGYANAAGIPYYPGLVKNRYIGRTFIQPQQHKREMDVHMKLNPIPHVIEGKRVIVIDDSLVRGTTSRRVVKLIREAGAKSVHFMVSSPPYRYPDFYGIDTPSLDHLMAATKSEEQIRSYLTADSLHYLSYDGLIAATGLPQSYFSTPCFDGVYPVDIGERRSQLVCPLPLPEFAIA